MKKMIKPIATIASAFLVGSILSTSALWSDETEISYEATHPHARLDFTVNGETKQVIKDDGSKDTYVTSFQGGNFASSSNGYYAEAELFSDDDIKELGQTKKLAKPISFDAETYGEIGLSSYKLTWERNSMKYGFTAAGGEYAEANLNEEMPRLEFTKGSLLSLTDPSKNKIVDVDDPANCTTDLLNSEEKHTKVLLPHYNGREKLELPITSPHPTYTEWSFTPDGKRPIPETIGIGANERKTDHLCMLLALPTHTVATGTHENTITVEGTGTEEGEKVTTSDSDTLTVDVSGVERDYTSEMEAQLEEEKIKVATIVVSPIYNPGNYSYKDFQVERG